jgi:hypothetical protein
MSFHPPPPPQLTVIEATTSQIIGYTEITTTQEIDNVC